MFSKAKQNRIFEDVIQQVEEAIVRGEIKPGERLPAERELIKSLEVSRGTLRESLRVLEQKGLIEIKPGAKGGIFVKQVNADQMSESLTLLIRSQQISLADLAQFREDLEGLVAFRAAERATPEDISELKELLEHSKVKFRAGAEGDTQAWHEFMDLDKEIHLALARIAGNPLHHCFLETVHNNIQGPNIRIYLSKDADTLKVSFEDTGEMIEAVARGDAEEARRLAQDHVAKFKNFMEMMAERSSRE